MPNRPYIPIDCDFHDELEAAATQGKTVELVLRDDAGATERIFGEIVDLGHQQAGESKGEYLTLKGGRRVRFDRIHSVDGKLRP